MLLRSCNILMKLDPLFLSLVFIFFSFHFLLLFFILALMLELFFSFPFFCGMFIFDFVDR